LNTAEKKKKETKKFSLAPGTENDGDYSSSDEEESDEAKDELDVMKERQFVTRKSTRTRSA
jgi:hypothetical protein